MSTENITIHIKYYYMNFDKRVLFKDISANILINHTNRRSLIENVETNTFNDNRSMLDNYTDQHTEAIGQFTDYLANGNTSSSMNKYEFYRLIDKLNDIYDEIIWTGSVGVIINPDETVQSCKIQRDVNIIFENSSECSNLASKEALKDELSIIFKRGADIPNGGLRNRFNNLLSSLPLKKKYYDYKLES